MVLKLGLTTWSLASASKISLAMKCRFIVEINADTVSLMRSNGAGLEWTWASRDLPSSSSREIQISLAIHATQEKTIQSTNIVPLEGEGANVSTTAKETEKKKRHNTLIRLTKLLFRADFVDRFLKWNDKRDRAVHETGNGGKIQDV